MAKKRTRKRSAKRRTRTMRRRAGGARRGGGAGLSGLSSSALEAELARRRGERTRLEKEHLGLTRRLAEIERVLSGFGGRVRRAAKRGAAAARQRVGKARRASKTGRRRPRNTMTLNDALVKILSGKQMGPTEAAAAVRSAGYKTTSPNFRTIVSQALARDKRIKKLRRGKYTSA
jgi:hypothetical protein